MAARLIFGLDFGSGSGIACSGPEMYPILARYCSAKYCSMLCSRGVGLAARLDVTG